MPPYGGNGMRRRKAWRRRLECRPSGSDTTAASVASCKSAGSAQVRGGHFRASPGMAAFRAQAGESGAKISVGLRDRMPALVVKALRC